MGQLVNIISLQIQHELAKKNTCIKYMTYIDFKIVQKFQ